MYRFIRRECEYCSGKFSSSRAVVYSIQTSSVNINVPKFWIIFLIVVAVLFLQGVTADVLVELDVSYRGGSEMFPAPFSTDPSE